MNDYISKPVKKDTLRKTIAKWVKPSRHANDDGSSHSETGFIDYDIFNTFMEVMADELEDSIRLFLHDAARLAEKIQIAYKENKLHEIAKMAHTLKSTSGAIGLNELSTIARNIEEEARIQIATGGGTDHIPEHVMIALQEGYQEAEEFMRMTMGQRKQALA